MCSAVQPIEPRETPGPPGFDGSGVPFSVMEVAMSGGLLRPGR